MLTPCATICFSSEPGTLSFLHSFALASCSVSSPSSPAPPMRSEFSDDPGGASSPSFASVSAAALPRGADEAPSAAAPDDAAPRLEDASAEAGAAENQPDESVLSRGGAGAPAGPLPKRPGDPLPKPVEELKPPKRLGDPLPKPVEELEPPKRPGDPLPKPVEELAPPTRPPPLPKNEGGFWPEWVFEKNDVPEEKLVAAGPVVAEVVGFGPNIEKGGVAELFDGAGAEGVIVEPKLKPVEKGFGLLAGADDPTPGAAPKVKPPVEAFGDVPNPKDMLLGGEAPVDDVLGVLPNEKPPKAFGGPVLATAFFSAAGSGTVSTCLRGDG